MVHALLNHQRDDRVNYCIKPLFHTVFPAWKLLADHSLQRVAASLTRSAAPWLLPAERGDEAGYHPAALDRQLNRALAVRSRERNRPIPALDMGGKSVTYCVT
jgi:hypothetical protein